VDRVHVDDQVADHRHVAHRLDLDHFLALVLAVDAVRGLVQVGVAGQPRLAVHPHAAGAADRLLAGAADADRAVLVVLDLENRVEHRLLRAHLDRTLVPVRGLARLRVVAADPQRVLGH
jgi:hypothetical protein